MSGTGTTTTAPDPTPLRRVRGTPAAGTQLRSLSRAMLLGMLRDKTSLFFYFLFPLMFLVIFGLVFSSNGASETELAVVGDGPVISALPEEVVETTEYDSVEDAVAAVEAGDLPGALVSEGDEVTLYFAASDQVRAGTVQGLVSAVVGQVNQAASGQPAAVTLNSQRVEDESFEPIQFITPGILSWGVAMSAAFGASLTLVAWRKRQVLRRLRLSPAPVWTIIGARVGVSLFIALVQAVLFVGVALTPPFGLRLEGSWWLALPLLLVGTCAFLAVGLLVGAISKTEEAASALANLVILPMAFLSGVFFDISATPEWMQAVSRVLPMRWMNDGMLDVMVRGQGVEAMWLPCLVLLAFTVVVAGVATRVFRWDDT